MKDLIKSWEKLAVEYGLQAQKETKDSKVRLLASASAFLFCAAQLKILIKYNSPSVGQDD